MMDGQLFFFFFGRLLTCAKPARENAEIMAENEHKCTRKKQSFDPYYILKRRWIKLARLKEMAISSDQLTYPKIRLQHHIFFTDLSNVSKLLTTSLM